MAGLNTCFNFINSYRAVKRCDVEWYWDPDEP